SQSIAASISPPDSVSAVLQSIMPAPVLSRRLLTMLAVIVAMSYLVGLLNLLDSCAGVRQFNSLVRGPGRSSLPLRSGRCRGAAGRSHRDCPALGSRSAKNGRYLVR